MSNFNEVQHKPLQVYNRAVMCYNILEDGGRAPLEDYIEQFSTEERREISQMMQLVKTLGVKKTVDLVRKGLTFSDDDYVSEMEDVI